MKLSMWTSYYAELTPEEAVRLLKENGYEFCEFSDEHGAALLARGDAKEVGAAFRAYCESIGMQVTQGHLHLHVHLCDESMPVLEIMHRWFDLFLAIGIKNAVLHCDAMPRSSLSREEKKEKNLAVLKQLTEYLKGTDLVICLENLTSICENADEIMWFVEKLDSPNVGICLDTGHLHIHEKEMTQEEFILGAGKLLHALHIADNDTSGDQHLMPYGRGTVDWNAVMRGLNAIGYCDCFNYEIPGERRLPMPVRDAKAEYLKTVTAYLFSL